MDDFIQEMTTYVPMRTSTYVHILSSYHSRTTGIFHMQTLTTLISLHSVFEVLKSPELNSINSGIQTLRHHDPKEH